MIGQPLNRVDGRLKVTGGARYSYEEPVKGVVYGQMVTSTIASGRIVSIDTTEAKSLPGVLTVLTHENAPSVKADGASPGDRKQRVLQDDLVYYDRQPVAFVIADTFERARDAAHRIRVTYDKKPPATTMESPLANAYAPKEANMQPPNTERGDFDAAYAAAPVKIDQVYTTPTEFHSPMEPHATVAHYEGSRLTVFDATQGVWPRRASLAKIMSIPLEDIRVITKFTGGAFGSKGSTNPHTVLAIMGAKAVGRPVKVALTREEMFGGHGYRPATHQVLRIGADRSGKLLAMSHDVRTQCSRFDEFIENSAVISRMMYDVANQKTSHIGVRYDVATPTYMRAPGESSGSFALESAMDELAYATGVDPVQLRLTNYAETDLDENKPFSSKSLRQCYAQAAEKFGWSQRPLKPRTLSKDGMLVGYGMATATYPSNRSTAAATATMHTDGTAYVESAGVDVGTGAYTAFTQVAAKALGLPPERVKFDLGDTVMPNAPVAGGSQLTASVANAVEAACVALREKVGALAGGGSPQGDQLAAIVKKHGSAVTSTAETQHDRKVKGPYASHAFGCHFAEVRVDPDFGTVRLARMVGAFAAGTIINEKTAHSQFLGGTVYGVSMALHEEGRIDERTGRYMNANLADYLVPVNADIPEIDIIIVNEVDEHVNPLGIKGIGEIGNVGSAAAVANAVYNATGVRVRDLPITPEKLM
jgi:xanthine dehydrogenase YagR molybdenum-binding subunit